MSNVDWLEAVQLLGFGTWLFIDHDTKRQGISTRNLDKKSRRQEISKTRNLEEKKSRTRNLKDLHVYALGHNIWGSIQIYQPEQNLLAPLLQLY